jgi:TM2 domain-containing membrane protein YozV
VNRAICPYCRAPVDPATEPAVICEGCETPHHQDCYEENGGCTVFGCQRAPADEPKVHVSRPELTGARTAGPVTATVSYPPTRSIYGLSGPAVAPSVSAQARVDVPTLDIERLHKNKMTFVLLGALLGPLGVHNFYAGYKKKALCQLSITVLSIGYGAPMSWIWAIIDICTVECDNNGVQFSS